MRPSDERRVRFEAAEAAVAAESVRSRCTEVGEDAADWREASGAGLLRELAWPMATRV